MELLCSATSYFQVGDRILRPLSLNIIGAGKLGKVIGCLLKKALRISAICNQSPASTQTAVAFIGEGLCSSSIKDLPPSDITLIAASDEAIFPIAEELSTSMKLQQGSIIFHCSGLLSSETLLPLKKKGCFLASIHPMKSFANPGLNITQYAGTYCAIEGDNEALSVLIPLFRSIGSVMFEIEKDKKALYHAAGVFASNYLLTLARQSLSCLHEAGVEEQLAVQIVSNLMKGTVSNLEHNLSPERALTGPIQRADLSTIKSHLQALNHEQKSIYSKLGLATIPLTMHDEEEKSAIKEALLP
ncbi:DUF2520 domain-containing protein [Legionella jordanis]|uniref:Rossmann-like and DUF2520 domain-containing protein n=1 Tax=Legionella jordanis TaxID=456 RepID=UPI000F00C6AA|nr:Rossmann-like and DUF2520 domain-containing protein [Legionella jordanis]RMX18350.1 DUF2520 domain-containing protein [Legionella jordanis]